MAIHIKAFQAYQYIHYEHLKLLINRVCSIELQSVKGSDTTGDDSSNAADQQKIFIRQNIVIKNAL